MQDYGTFTRYTPTLPDDHPLKAFEGRAFFMKNEAEQDFYQLRLTLPSDVTWLAVNGTNIRMASNDVQCVVPDNMRLVSITRADDPSGLVGKDINANGAILDPPEPASPALNRQAFEQVGAALGMTSEQIAAMIQAAEARA